MLRTLTIALVTLALGSCESRPTVSTATPSASARVAAPLRPAGLLAVERVTGGARPEERLPLVVALHGLGDDAASFMGLFDGLGARARVVVLQAPTPHGAGFSWFPFRPDADDATRARALTEPAARVARAIGELAALRPTRGKPLVTGFSQGGMLSFTIAARHPEVIGMAIPVGGLLPPPLFPQTEVADAPRVQALHGAKDSLVPEADGYRGVGALAQKGYDARFDSFGDVGHQIPPAMRAALHGHIAAYVAGAGGR